MDFYLLLNEKHSKATTNLIVEEVVAHPQKIDELINIFLLEDIRMSQRAAWPISFIAEKNPLLIETNLSKLLTKLRQKEVHPANIRNIFRAIQYITIPEELEGLVLTKAFEYLNNMNSPVAVKIFCMTVIDQLSVKYPDIKPELKASIKTQLIEGSAGIKSRGNKILKKIK